MHASTVASNTILEGRGARTALITTEGFRDVLEMRRLRIPVLYDVQYESPPPLVPRRLRYEIAERLGPRGEVWRELDEAAVEAVAATDREPRTSRRSRSRCSTRMPTTRTSAGSRRSSARSSATSVYVTRSSEILPEIREYERTSTAVVNAYVGPAITRYIALARRAARGRQGSRRRSR